MFEKVQNSNGRTGQIKILNCMLYFTEQVEVSMITKNSLHNLSKNIKLWINEIWQDLRYDICDHKQEEIWQLNAFLHYIDEVLGFFPDQEGFEWKNTIKMYEKDYSVVVLQNEVEYFYGFEPKEIQSIINLNWSLTSASIFYGPPSKMTTYKFKSYIIAVPFFHLAGIENSFLSDQKNFNAFLSAIEYNQFVAMVSYDERESKLFNELHTQIIYVILKNKEKFNHSEHEKMNKPMLK